MKQRFFIVLFVTLTPLGHSSLLYGNYVKSFKTTNFSFDLTFPYDWQLATVDGLPKNILGVLEPHNIQTSNKPATIYIRIAPKPAKKTSLKKFMKDDFSNVKKKRPNLQFGTDFSLKTKDTKEAQIKTYFQEPQGLYDAIAYIQEDDVFIMIILQTTSQKAYLRALPTFRNIITSYQRENPHSLQPQEQLDKQVVKPKKPKKTVKKRKQGLHRPPFNDILSV